MKCVRLKIDQRLIDCSQIQDQEFSERGAQYAVDMMMNSASAADKQKAQEIVTNCAKKRENSLNLDLLEILSLAVSVEEPESYLCPNFMDLCSLAKLSVLLQSLRGSSRYNKLIESAGDSELCQET